MNKLIIALILVLITGILGTCLLVYTSTVMQPDFPASIVIKFILGDVFCALVLTALIMMKVCE